MTPLSILAATRFGVARRTQGHCNSSSSVFACLRIGAIETFRGPAVERSEKSAGFAPPALITPVAGKAVGGSQLREFRALPLGNDEGMMVTPLGRCAISCGNQQIASHPVQVSLVASRGCGG